MDRNGTYFDPGPVLEHFEDATAREVADVLGVSIATVHAWRQGRRGLRAHHADELAIKLRLRGDRATIFAQGGDDCDSGWCFT